MASYIEALIKSLLSQYTFTLCMSFIGIYVWLSNTDATGDYYRVFALIMGAIIIGFVSRIIYLSRITHSNKAKLFRSIPTYIVVLAFSYITFVFSAHIRLLYDFGEEITWHGLPFVIAGDILGMAALGMILRIQEANRKAIKHKK